MQKYFIQPADLQLDACSAVGSVLFVGNSRPEISWRNAGGGEDFRQSAYQVTVRGGSGKELWNSGKVKSSCCRWIPWGGSSLASRQEGILTVRVWDEEDRMSEESQTLCFEAGLLENRDWDGARWIWHDGNNYSVTAPSPLFRRDFSVKNGLRKARLYITARGVFEASLDGARIGRDYLAPGWTDFRKQIQVMTYDLTGQLQPGAHTLGAMLADGWCCGNLTCLRMRNFYHPHPELLARLELTYEDGSRETVGTDSAWRCSTGPVVSADLYDGEVYDERLEVPGWDCPGFAADDWRPAVESGAVEELPLLVPRTAPPVRRTEELKPVRILRPEDHVCIWDFGQNFTGVFRVRFRGSQGRIYTFKVAEMLEKNGTLYTLNYRAARSEDSYVCAGPMDRMVEYVPRFTFHGFRYLQIDGWQFEKLDPEEMEVTGLVMHGDMPVTSGFSCGREDVNRLWLNALWGQKSNFLEIPTDCPQRDERLGWTGDAEIFAPMAVLNMDCCAFFRKFLRDVRDGMQENGAAPSIAPSILRLWDGAAGWGDAIVLIPWILYRQYGWKEILRENYEAMTRSLAFQMKQADSGLQPGDNQFGDWLAPEETPKALVATAYYAHCLRCVAEIAGVLDKTEDAAYYSRLADESAGAFQRKFSGEDGVVAPDSQTALVLALAFNLLEKEKISVNLDRLEEKIRKNGCRLSTGFLGTGLILEVLEKYGRCQTACDLLLQDECPSWLYPVRQGATTFWERWDSFTKEGHRFGDVTMNSFNHYAYGAAMRFLVEGLGGIHYSHEELLLKPVFDRRFSPVSAAYDSPFGKITSSWKWEEGRLLWKAVLPPGMPAVRAILPDGREIAVPAGETTLWDGPLS